MLAGVEPARAACIGEDGEIPGSHPPGRVSLAVVGELSRGARPSSLVQADVGRRSAAAGRQVAAERSAATLSPRVARRTAADTAVGGEVTAAGGDTEAAVLELALQRKFAATASECSATAAGARRGFAWGVARAAFEERRFSLLQVFLAAATAGRHTASSRDAG